MTDRDASQLGRTPEDDPGRRVRIKAGVAGFPSGAAGTVVRVDPPGDPNNERVHVAVRCQGLPDVLPFAPEDLLVRP